MVSALIAIGFTVLLTAPSLIAFGLPTYAVLPVMAIVPIAATGYMFTNAITRGAFRFNFNLLLLLLLVLNLAIFASGFMFSLRNGVPIAHDQLVNTAAYVFIASVSALLFCTLVSNSRYPATSIMSALFIASLLICVINMMLIAGGLENPASIGQPQTQSPGMFSKALGLGINRIMMPLSSGFQNGAVVPTTLCVLSAGFSGRYKALRLFAFVLGALLLLLLDTRMFMVAIGMAFAVRFARSAIAIAAAAIAFPWLEVVFVNFSQNFPTLAALATGRVDKYGLFSGREFVWNCFWDYFAKARSSQVFFGNGLFGQANTGVSKNYAEVFHSWSGEMRATISLHNAFLQMIMDTGILGLVAFCVLLFAVVRRAEVLATIDVLDGSGWRVLSLLLLTFASIAGTEMVIGWYMKESVSITASLFFILAFFGGRRTDGNPTRSANPTGEGPGPGPVIPVGG